MKKTVIIIAIVFVAVLAVSIGIQVATSPDFEGFGNASKDEPSVTYLPGGEDGEDQTVENTFNWKEHPVFVIGDSLTKGAQKEIEKAVANIIVDGSDGRTMSQGLAVLKEWDDNGTMTEDAIIIICLAHNVTGATERDAQQIIDMIKPGQSLIMMTGHGRSEMEPINEFIRSLPRAYSYIAVADWDLTVAQSPSLLASDNIHIAKRQGNELYADLILRALEVAQPMPIR